MIPLTFYVLISFSCKHGMSRLLYRLIFYWLKKKKGVNPDTDSLSFKALVSRW